MPTHFTVVVASLADSRIMQKSDGTFALVVWSELVTGTNQVAVNFGKKLKALEVYDPTVGTASVEGRQNLQVLPLALTDHPVVVQFSDRGN